MVDDPDELDEQDEEDDTAREQHRRRRFGITLAGPLETVLRRLRLDPRAWLLLRPRTRRRRP
jgi:hypothetical protein